MMVKAAKPKPIASQVSKVVSPVYQAMKVLPNVRKSSGRGVMRPTLFAAAPAPPTAYNFDMGINRFRAPALAAGLLVSTFAAAQELELRDVVLVGSNWQGTAEIFDPHSFQILKRIDIAPDRAERIQEIRDAGLRRYLTYKLIQWRIGEGNDQLVDDLFPSKDGRFIYASRPSFADVVALEVATGTIAWRTPVEGMRSDH